MFSLNPILEREWRERFRRPASHVQVGGLVLFLACVLCFGIWHTQLQPGLSALDWRANGRAMLATYRVIAGLVFWCSALLLGAVSVSDEKSAATWEHLLLCPLEGPGLATGKIASGALWLLCLQLVLWPVLLIAGLCFGATPLEVAVVMTSHLLLTIQGATLGFWGALRGKNLTEGLAHAIAGIGRMAMQCVLIVMLNSWLLTLLAVVLRTVVLISPTLLKPVWFNAVALVVWGTRAFASVVAGVLGVGVGLLDSGIGGFQLMPSGVYIGQLLGTALFLKWSAWEISYPTRDFWGVTPTPTQTSGLKANSHLRVLYGVWSWTLSPLQLAAFPVRQGGSEGTLRSRPPVHLEPRYKAPSNSNSTPSSSSVARRTVKRLRLPVARRLIEMNPVLWLDMTRVLSLRSPDSAMLPFLLLAGALGGSVLLAVSISLFIGWTQNVLSGTAGDLSSLRSGWDGLHQVLRYGALVCGPLWGATGYVIERRTGMLLELRLTLLSAWALWWGKFAARFGTFALFSLPLLALVAFFASNWPGKSGVFETFVAALSTWALAAWSLLACLCISDACRKELSAALWCCAFALGWGVLMWQYPEERWTLFHLVGASGAGLFLLWRLKRLGFG